MLLSVVAALALAAQPPSPWLDEARTLVGELRFADAIARLEVARQVPGLDPAELRAVLELLAYCQVAEGKREAAEATYMTLLKADPALELSRESSSPKVLEALEAAKTKLFPPDYVRLEEQAAPAGQAKVSLVDPWQQVRVLARFERRDGGDWRELPVETAEEARSYRFPLQVAAGTKLEWYLEARGDNEVVLARLGTPAEPRVLQVPALVVEPAPPVGAAPPKRGLRVAGFITLGLGVALGAVATGLQVSGWEQRQAARDPSRPPGDFADTARAAEARGQNEQTWATGLFIAGGAAAATGVVLAW